MDLKLENLLGKNLAKVGKIKVKIGDTAKTGDILMQIEGSKGNSPFKAKKPCKIEKILVTEGQTVHRGDSLFEISLIENSIEDESKSTETKSTSNTKSSFNYFSGMLKKKTETLSCDLAIIGAGPGGYVAAIYAAQNGLNTVLIENTYIGGTCLNIGCIPTKTFIKSSEIFYNTVHSDIFGVSSENPQIDMNKVVSRKNSIVETLTSGVSDLLEKHNIKVINGTACFENEKTLLVSEKNIDYTINPKNIIIATGAKMTKRNVKGYDSPFILNSTKALNYKKVPKSIAILGGGVIGLEFAFIYANLGSKVSIISHGNRLLKNFDSEISNELYEIANEKGIDVFTSSNVTRIDKSENEESIIVFENDNKEKYLVSEDIFIAPGREPNIDGLNLEKTNVKLNDNGKGIKVDEFLKTNVENIYAIGDVTNKYQLAHVASHQGIVAVDNILGKNRKMNYNFVPDIVFTTPEIASIGINEDQAKKQKLNIKISKYPFAANGKALTMNEERGFIKIIKDTDKNKIIGGSIIGPDASSLIAALTLIIKNNISEKDVTETIFAHPTTSEVIHEAFLGLGLGAINYHE